MEAEDELVTAHQKLVDLESQVDEQRRARNSALKTALRSGITWRRAQEITGLSPRGVQISIKDA